MAERHFPMTAPWWVTILFACLLVSCADVQGTGGRGGSAGGSGGFGGTGGTGVGGSGGSDGADCGFTTPEANDNVDEVNSVGTGTLNGECTFVGSELIGCEGPDLLDEVFVTQGEDGPLTVDLVWENASSDLDLAVWSLPPACDSLALSTNAAGTMESVTFTLAAGTEVVVSILAVDTNGAPEPYTVTLR